MERVTDILAIKVYAPYIKRDSLGNVVTWRGSGKVESPSGEWVNIRLSEHNTIEQYKDRSGNAFEVDYTDYFNAGRGGIKDSII